MKMRFLVFTDLDGTLLDHDTYAFAPATEALAKLAREEIPVVINTSKTFEEVRVWRDRLGLATPFIVENGSALVIPNKFETGTADTALPGATLKDGFRWLEFGASLDEIRAGLRAINEHRQFKYRGFSEISARELAALTGLGEREARDAKARLYSEPVLWGDDESALSAFTEELKTRHLTAVRGGRFVHIMGATDKGAALRETARWFAALYDAQITTIALGDSPNDCEMLEAADIAVIVNNRNSPTLSIAGTRSLYTKAEGPSGWQEAFDELFHSDIR